MSIKKFLLIVALIVLSFNSYASSSRDICKLLFSLDPVTKSYQKAEQNIERLEESKYDLFNAFSYRRSKSTPFVNVVPSWESPWLYAFTPSMQKLTVWEGHRGYVHFEKNGETVEPPERVISLDKAPVKRLMDFAIIKEPAKVFRDLDFLSKSVLTRESTLIRLAVLNGGTINYLKSIVSEYRDPTKPISLNDSLKFLEISHELIAINEKILEQITTNDNISKILQLNSEIQQLKTESQEAAKIMKRHNLSLKNLSEQILEMNLAKMDFSQEKAKDLSTIFLLSKSLKSTIQGDPVEQFRRLEELMTVFENFRISYRATASERTAFDRKLFLDKIKKGFEESVERISIEAAKRLLNNPGSFGKNIKLDSLGIILEVIVEGFQSGRIQKEKLEQFSKLLISLAQNESLRGVFKRPGVIDRLEQFDGLMDRVSNDLQLSNQ